MSNIRKFIDIVSEDSDAVRAEIGKKIQNIPDEEDLLNILKFTNKYGIKKDVEKFTTLRNYKNIVSSVFLQALADANLKPDEVKKFLKKLADDGILNEKKLLTPRQVHSYSDLIDKEYQTVFDSIKVDLFQKISGKIGEMGDVGKGEYLLDIISTTVNRRGAPGDLDIDGTKIELKAGENGRLGPAGSMSLAGRFQKEFAPFIQQLMPDKPLEGISPTEFNPKQNMSYFTEFFETSENVKAALGHMMSMHYPNYDVDVIVNAAVDGSGNISGNELKKQMLKASFESYKDVKEFDGVIVMDSAITKFLYIGSGDDLVASADQLTVSFPSWTDQQSNCMKMTLAKRGPAVGGGSGAKSPAKSAAKPNVITGKKVDIRPIGASPKPKKADLGRERR